MLQPWYQVKYKGGNTKLLSKVSLEYDIEIAVIPENIRLAVEDLTHIRQILVNGKEIPLASKGKWIDICFDELEIPVDSLVKGRNTIAVAMDYYSTCGIEAAYLLGDFGVEMAADVRPILTTLPEKLAIGDITDQGLPFYSGSVIYELDETLEGQKGCHVSVKAHSFGGALVKIHGESDETIAFPPYQTDVTDLRSIEVVLTRRNTFGPLHQCPKEAPSYGPGNFMTTGEGWSDAYMFYPQGLLEKPEVRRG